MAYWQILPMRQNEQIFDFWFLMDLHVLGCLDNDLTIFGKCVSVRLSVALSVCLYLPVRLCVCDKNFVANLA